MGFFRRFLAKIRRFKKPQTKARPKLDSRSEKNIETLLPVVQDTFRDLASIAKRVAGRYGLDAKVISGHRSYEEQQVLYNKGRTTPGPKVTTAPPGFSNHNFQIACDLGIFEFDGEYVDSRAGGTANKIYKIIANTAEAEGLNLAWGGHWTRFPDPPHWEYKTGFTMSEMRSRKAAGLSIV